MAGIGFRLHKLMNSGRLGTATAAFGYGVVLSSGQWLIAMIGISIIGTLVSGRLESDLIIDFRVSVVYTVMLSMIAVSLFLSVSTRLVSDALHEKASRRVPGLLAATLILATGSAMALGAVVMFGFLQIGTFSAVVLMITLTLFSLLWIVAGFAGAIQHVNWVLWAYLLGGIASVVGAVWGGIAGQTVIHMVLGYAAGIAFTVAVLSLRIFLSFPFQLPDLKQPVMGLLYGVKANRYLALGAVAGAIGIWIDKWMVWAFYAGNETRTGLPYAQYYDSAVYIGLLSLIPGLAILYVHLETRFFAQIRGFLSRMLGHASLTELDTAAEDLRVAAMQGLHRVLILQAAIALALIALTPFLAQSGILIYRQIPVAILTIFGAWFFFLSVTASTLLVYLDMPERYAAVQVTFFVSVTLATALGLWIGPRALGIGFAGGSIVAGVLAYHLLAQSLGALNYHLFNASASKSSGRPGPAQTY